MIYDYDKSFVDQTSCQNGFLSRFYRLITYISNVACDTLDRWFHSNSLHSLSGLLIIYSQS